MERGERILSERQQERHRRGRAQCGRAICSVPERYPMGTVGLGWLAGKPQGSGEVRAPEALSAELEWARSQLAGSGRRTGRRRRAGLPRAPWNRRQRWAVGFHEQLHATSSRSFRPGRAWCTRASCGRTPSDHRPVRGTRPGTRTKRSRPIPPGKRWRRQ